jgi:flagellar basal-body rod protein FlgB
MLEHIGQPLERYMTQLSARQKVVASNIANADTPGYKTKDISFGAEFANSLAGGEPEVIEANGLSARNDGNNVSLDREARLLAENALRFNVASNLVRSELRSIRSALQENK